MSSMMLPPGEAPAGLPMPPGGGMPGPGGPAASPMDSLAGQSLPSGGGIEGLLAALQGGGGGEDLPGGGLVEPDSDIQGMSSIDHIQQAMKHLMMALGKESDEERGAGITKGMGALQGILAGEQKKNSQLSALGG